jgi:hypothetical protein
MLPAVQFVHKGLDEPEAYMPAEQTVHSSEPVVLANLPAKQIKHELAPEEEDVPTAQLSQLVTNAPAEYLPATHELHALPSTYWPIKQEIKERVRGTFLFRESVLRASTPPPPSTRSPVAKARSVSILLLSRMRP